MEIVYLPIGELKPFQKNPKRHPRRQIDALKKSMETFGYTNPVIINKDNMVVAGHGRLLAAKELGFTEIPTIKLDLPYEKAVAYVLADNRLAELAENDDKLTAEILEMVKDNPDIDMEAVGYNDSEMETLLKEIQKHDNIYKPGGGPQTKVDEFINDAEKALYADEEAKELFKGRSTVLYTYSGGMDSTFALLWGLRNFPNLKHVPIFSDTGYEFPGMTAHIHAVCKHLGVEPVIVRPKIDIFSYWQEKGRFFNMIVPECQSNLIFEPIDEYISTYDPSDVIILSGSRGDQVRRLSKKSKTSGSMNPKMKDYQYYHPCFDITYEIEYQTVMESGIPIWEGYAMGFKRSACWCCPGQSSQQAYALQKNYPGLANVIRRWEKKLNMNFKSKDKNFDSLVEYWEKKLARKAEMEAKGETIEDEVDNDDRWISSGEELSEDDLIKYGRE